MIRHALTLPLALCALLSLPVATVASDAVITEITVTATRRAALAEDIIGSLSLVDSESVRSQAIATDAIANSVGVFLQQTTPGQGAAIIRGLRGSSVLHLVDGMRLNNAIFRSAPTQYLALVPTHAIERIEILRGTPASLYGSDAVAGVIQVVTRIPRFDTAQTSLRGESLLGFDSAALSRTLRGYIDVGNDRLAATIGAGYQQSGDRRVAGGERVGPSGFDARSARVALSFTPDERTGWIVDLHAYEQPSTPRIDELTPGFGQSEPASSEFRFTPNRRLFARAGHTVDGGPFNLDWKLDLAWQRIDDDRTTRAFGADVVRRESNRSDLFGTAISAARLHDRGSWIVGAELYHDRVRSARTDTDMASGIATASRPRYPDGATLQQAAVYANAEARVASAHALSGGLRVTRVDVDVPASGAAPGYGDDIWNLSGDIGWRLEVTNWLALQANAAAGFRAPNIFDLGTLGERPGNRFSIPNAGLDAERAYQGEVGIRLRRDAVRLDVSLFHLRYEDRITSVATGDLTADGREIVQSRNAASATIRGLELGFTANVSATLSGTARLTYTRGSERLAGAAETPADRIPPLNGLVSVTWEINSRWAGEARLTFADGQDRLSPRDIRDPRIDPAGTAGWGALGAKVHYANDDDWQLTFGIENLLDAGYRNHGSGIDAAGRSLYATLRHRWR